MNNIVTSDNYIATIGIGDAGYRPINTSGFANIPHVSNIITKAEFERDILKAGIPVFLPKRLNQYILDVQDNVEKGLQEETLNAQQATDILKGVRTEMSRLRPMFVHDSGTGEKYQIYIPIEEAMLKKAEEDNELQKADIARALTGYYSSNNQVSFSKTGKEIADKVGAKITSFDALISNKEKEAADLLSEIGFKPMEDVSEYEWADMTHLKEIHPGLKRFGYSMCYFDSKATTNNTPYGGMDYVSGETPAVGGVSNCATSQEQAKSCQMYNDCIRSLVNMYCDREALSFWKRNVEEKKSYTLEPKMAFLLGF